MALTAQIRSSEATFKLAQRLVDSLSERFSFNKDDAWNHVSSMSVEAINRKMRKERRKANPASQVKKPRTAFSFFTQQQRPLIQSKNPTAKFGDLSRLVSNEWKALTEAQMKDFKEREAADRARYDTELAAAKARASAEPTTEPAAAQAASEPSCHKPTRGKKAVESPVVANAPAPVPAPVTTTPAAESNPAPKTPKSNKTPKQRPTVTVSSTTLVASTSSVPSSSSKKSKAVKA